ncbi:hypothetical protein MJI46_34150, partial [Salmonella enterica subsp. enterica serovar Cerro]|nr:hypothetical protein [Salmonella enterica subsp. enterica serovar Cerro]
QQAITPVAYDSYLNAFTDLKNNRLEGVFGDVAAIGKWLKNNPVEIQNENQTLASITFQNYFRLYEKLAGMTGTADTEAFEFSSI